jgi:lipopolysaccharide export LptBFGC system permease protein LptF
MKVWQTVMIVVLLVSLLVFSSCDLLGIGGKSKEQKYLEQQLELMQQQQAAAQKAQDDYYQALQKALNDYLKQYNDYQQAQQQQQIQAIQQAAQDKQPDIPYN